MQHTPQRHPSSGGQPFSPNIFNFLMEVAVNEQKAPASEKVEDNSEDEQEEEEMENEDECRDAVMQSQQGGFYMGSCSNRSPNIAASRQ